MFEIVLSQVQDFARGLVELLLVFMGSSPNPIKVPLDDIPSLQHLDHPTQIDVISKLLRVNSIPLSLSPKKTLNSTGPIVILKLIKEEMFFCPKTNHKMGLTATV